MTRQPRFVAYDNLIATRRLQYQREDWLYLLGDHCPRSNGGQDLALGASFLTRHPLGYE